MAYGTINAGTIAPGSGNTLTIDGSWTAASQTCANLGAVTTTGTMGLGGKLTAGSNEIEGSNFDITGGSIVGTTIGTSSHTTGKFTTCDATTDFTIGGLVVTDGQIADTGTLALVPVDGCTIALGTDDGDDFNVGSGKFVVEGNTGSVGIGTASMYGYGLFIDHANTGYGGWVCFFDNSASGTGNKGVAIRCGTDAGVGTAMAFQEGDGDEAGSITFSGGTTSYNAFTAGHDVELPEVDNADGYPYGTLVETTEIFYKQKNGENTERGILYKVQKSSSAYSKSVLGAYSIKFDEEPATDEILWTEDDNNIPEGVEIGDVKLKAFGIQNENRHQVYVLGDGHILCNGEKGNISVGDGICTSSTDGEGMKADKMAMIIGIAQEDVSFSGSAKLIVVQYGLRQFTPWVE